MRGFGTIGKRVIRPGRSEYIQEHKDMLREHNPTRLNGWIMKHHNSTFNAWFEERLSLVHVSDTLATIAWGPTWDLITWKGYQINGYTFYTKQKRCQKHELKQRSMHWCSRNRWKQTNVLWVRKWDMGGRLQSRFEDPIVSVSMGQQEASHRRRQMTYYYEPCTCRIQK